jgi:predicted small metal-binding protein
MSILIIDGVKYEAWTPPNEDEFERMVKEHARDIFGKQSIYLDLKQKLKSKSGIGSIPDGYVIIFGDEPCWHIVEAELSSHPLYEHIVQQISKFINSIKNFATQREITNAIYQEIKIKMREDESLKFQVSLARRAEELIMETYKFLSELISKPPVLTVIIEKHSQELSEALSALAHPQIKVVEFQTFTRAGVGLTVHAHLVEPLYGSPTESVTIIQTESSRRRKVVYQNSKLSGVTKTANELLHEHLDKLPKDIQDKVRYADDHRGSRTWARYVELAQSKGHLTDWTPVR